MNRLIFLLLIFFTASCNVNEKERIPKNTKSNFHSKRSNKLFIDTLNFKYSNLREFDLRGWNHQTIEDSLTAFSTKESLFDYFQDKRLLVNEIYPVNFRYFSIQKNEKFEKILTILESDESCCNDLHYLIYNSKNELISDNIVAGIGGDGMWSYYQYGNFINDSTYLLTRIDKEEAEDLTSETTVDSVITTYRFYKDKPFKKLTEQKFKKTE